MRASELFLIISVAIFAAVICYQSLNFRYLSPQGFGPGFVPLNFAAATLVLGILILVKAHRGAAGRAEARWTTDRLRAVGPAAVTIALLFAATYLMQLGSVFAPLFAVMVVISRTMLGHSWVRAVVLNAIALAAVYGIFNLWLNIPVT